MKFLLLFVTAAVFLPAAGVRAFAQQSADREIQAIMAQAKAQYEKIALMEGAEIDPIKAIYLQQLRQVRETPQVRGSTEALTELEAVMKAVEERLPAPPAKTTASIFQGFKTNYDRNLSNISRKYDASRLRLETDFQTAMKDLEQRYAQRLDLDAAREVREVRKNGLPAGGAFWSEPVDVLPEISGTPEREDGFVVCKTAGGFTTPVSYRPPLEISYVLKADGQVRISYASDAIIFNWERNRTELRIDGGPAGTMYRPKVGGIPMGKLITIRQVVLPKRMIIYVDGEERTTWEADFSQVNQPIRIFAHGDAIYVKQLLVRKPR